MRARFQEISGKWRFLWGHAGFRRAPATTVFRLLRWRLHCGLGIPSTVNLRPWGVRLFLPARWGGAGTTMIFAVRAQYERELNYLHRFLSPGMVFIDGGANCGIYTVVAARLVGPSGRVFSFEPGAEAFAVLTKNIEINHFTNVQAHRAALSDTDGSARLYHHEHGPNSFSIGRSGNAAIDSEPVVTRALDQVFRDEDSGRLGLIKLDIEGAEELALRGASRILAHSCPTIIFEVNVAAAKQLGLQPYGAWEFLMECGYRFFSLNGCSGLCELDKPPAVDAVDNVIALHGKRCR